MELNKRPTFTRGSALNFLQRKWWLVAIMLALLAALIFFAYGYFDTRNQLVKLNSPESSKNDEVNNILKEIGKYLELPQETPTLGSITDASKLKDQDFFKDAQDGDKLLIFTKSGRALLYRPSSHKVIEYSKVSLNTSADSKKQ